MRVGAKLILAMVAAWASLGGCAAFAPRADPSSFYILGALPEAEMASDRNAAASKADFTVGLGPIELPGYLDRQQIVTRTSSNRLSYSEHDRWAAPLAESIGRILGQNISHLLGAARISQFPWQSGDAPDYQVKIEVLQFEGNSDQQARLAARWTVLDRNKKILLGQSSQLNRRAASLSAEDNARALSETLGDLSRAIAQTLLSFGK